jgi:hypothetical protein
MSFELLPQAIPSPSVEHTQVIIVAGAAILAEARGLLATVTTEANRKAIKNASRPRSERKAPLLIPSRIRELEDEVDNMTTRYAALLLSLDEFSKVYRELDAACAMRKVKKAQRGRGEAEAKSKAVAHCEHCALCVGQWRRSCTCEYGCSVPDDKVTAVASGVAKQTAKTKCVDHCEHCEGDKGYCDCLQGCARPESARCRPRHCRHCTGSAALHCSCTQGCARPASVQCRPRHCVHCIGKWNKPCSCKVACVVPDGAECESIRVVDPYNTAAAPKERLSTAQASKLLERLGTTASP